MNETVVYRLLNNVTEHLSYKNSPVWHGFSVLGIKCPVLKPMSVFTVVIVV